MEVKEKIMIEYYETLRFSGCDQEKVKIFTISGIRANIRKVHEAAKKGEPNIF